MKKVVLIDGNNLIFRSYYATAYRGEILTNSKGLPTNAVYAYIQMLLKIIAEEKPSHIMVEHLDMKVTMIIKVEEVKLQKN